LQWDFGWNPSSCLNFVAYPLARRFYALLAAKLTFVFNKLLHTFNLTLIRNYSHKAGATTTYYYDFYYY